MKCNQSRPGFELVPPCPFPTTITITPRAPPKVIYLSIAGKLIVRISKPEILRIWFNSKCYAKRNLKTLDFMKALLKFWNAFSAYLSVKTSILICLISKEKNGDYAASKRRKSPWTIIKDDGCQTSTAATFHCMLTDRCFQCYLSALGGKVGVQLDTSSFVFELESLADWSELEGGDEIPG